MSLLADQVLFNVILATGLAVVAYLSRFAGRPVVTHSLWLIVLVRLIMPPVWSLPWPIRTQPQAITGLAPIADVSMANVETPALVSEELVDGLSPIPLTNSDSIARTVAWDIPWMIVAISLWTVVALTWWSLVLVRAVRFHRLLRQSESEDTGLRDLVAKLSRRIGLKSPPAIVAVPMRMSPCVWCFGRRPFLLLPQDWSARLGKLDRTAVILHELAHLKRGDHWVRWLEVIVTGMYWWLPLVWIARRELRDAEEQCCDGWVVATLPAARRVYANALIDMADYLKPVRPALPPLCSGFGQVHELRRRLNMILHAKPQLRSGRAGAAIALGLGLFLLPFGIARSDDEQEQPAPRPKAERREADDPPSEERQRQREIELRNRERARADESRARDRARADEERERGRAGDNRRGTEVERLRTELAAAQDRLAQMQRTVETLRARLAELGVDVREVRARSEPGRPFAGSEAPRSPIRGEATRPARPPEPPAPPAPPIRPGTGGGGFSAGPGGAGRGLSDQRVEQLERQLDMLRRELAEMRREMRGQPDRRDNDRRDVERDSERRKSDRRDPVSGTPPADRPPQP